MGSYFGADGGDTGFAPEPVATKPRRQKTAPARLEQREEKRMRSITDTVIETGTAAKDAAIDGFDMALSQQAAEEVLNAVKHVAGDAYPDILEEEVLKDLAPFIVSVLVHAGMGALQDQIPHADLVQRKAMQAMRATSKDTAKAGIELVRPFLVGVAGQLVGHTGGE